MYRNYNFAYTFIGILEKRFLNDNNFTERIVNCQNDNLF